MKTRKKNGKRDHKRDWRKSRNGKKHPVCVYACTCPLALLPVPPAPLLLFLSDGIGSGSPQDLRGNIKHRIISEPPPSHPFPLARSPSHQHRHSFSSTAKSSESCLNPFFPLLCFPLQTGTGTSLANRLKVRAQTPYQLYSHVPPAILMLDTGKRRS